MLLDTGANLSVPKKYCLEDDVIYIDHKARISGISGNILSVGNANVGVIIGTGNVNHLFTILDHFETRVDGNLGSDFFIKYGACID